MTATLTKSTLAHHIEAQIGLDHYHALALVEMFFETIMQSLENNQEVKLPTLGTFSVRRKKARIGRNPKTGKTAKITARRVTTFQTSATLKKKLLSLA